MEVSESHAALERAERVIPLGTQTMSKHVSQFVGGVSPLFIERGQGSHVWDVDGNEYVDFPMALGPVILGYAEPVVDEAIRGPARARHHLHALSPARGRRGRAHHRSVPGCGGRALRQERLRRRFRRGPGRPSPHRSGPRPGRRLPRLARLVHRLDHAGPRGAEGRPGLDAGVPRSATSTTCEPSSNSIRARSRPWSWSRPVPRSPRPATSRRWSIWPTNTGPWPCSTR